jgi:hypothetical protein
MVFLLARRQVPGQSICPRVKKLNFRLNQARMQIRALAALHPVKKLMTASAFLRASLPGNVRDRTSVRVFRFEDLAHCFGGESAPGEKTHLPAALGGGLRQYAEFSVPGRATDRELLRMRPLHSVFNKLGGYATSPEVVLYLTAAEFARQRVGAGLRETRLRQPAARDERVQQLFDLFGRFRVGGEFARSRTVCSPPREHR